MQDEILALGGNSNNNTLPSLPHSCSHSNLLGMSINTRMGPSRSLSDNPCSSLLQLISSSLAGEREGGGHDASKACNLDKLFDGGKALRSQSVATDFAQQTGWDVGTNFMREVHE